MQGLGQPTFPQHKGRALGQLCLEEGGRRQSGGIEILGVKIQPNALQAMSQIGGRVFRVVGKNHELVLALTQPVNETVRTGDDLAAADDHPVHVDEIGFGHNQRVGLQG